MSKCKSCGADIIWIKTPAGKVMPCDPTRVRYIEKSETASIVKSNGEVSKCELILATGLGYIPHWATCPDADRHRKKK